MRKLFFFVCSCEKNLRRGGVEDALPLLGFTRRFRTMRLHRLVETTGCEKVGWMVSLHFLGAMMTHIFGYNDIVRRQIVVIVKLYIFLIFIALLTHINTLTWMYVYFFAKVYFLH